MRSRIGTTVGRAAALALALSLGPGPWPGATPVQAQAQGPEVASGSRAVLRGLDKVSGETVDLSLNRGEEITFARLQITLVACRYPVQAPESDAFAFLEIRHARNGEQLFRGWMVASSPALNALDDPRYDIWVLSCE